MLLRPVLLQCYFCDDQYCCTTFCDLDASQCPQPTFCVPFFEQENPDYPNLGLCVLP